MHCLAANRSLGHNTSLWPILQQEEERERKQSERVRVRVEHIRNVFFIRIQHSREFCYRKISYKVDYFIIKAHPRVFYSSHKA